MRTSTVASSSTAAQFGQIVLDRVRRLGDNRGSSPFRLRIALLITVAVALAFAVLGTYGVNKRKSSIEAAQHAAAQLIDLQGIRVSVVEADAIASRSYLVGGQEDPVTRNDYLDSVAAASTALVKTGLQLDLDAAQTEQLQDAGTSLATYTGLVEQARANNRQGFPIAAAYQRQANAESTRIVIALRTVESGQRKVVNDNLAAAHRAGIWLTAVGWVLVALLVLGAVWLALLFRRIINVPIALAVLALLAMVIVGGAAQARSITDADDAVGGALTTADLVAQARASAFDAQSQEALALINRGNGAANEASWEQASGITATALDEACDRTRDLDEQLCSLGAKWTTYRSGHAALREADDTGDWDTAVAISLGSERDGVDTTITTVPFDTFIADSEAVLEGSAVAARDELAAAADRLAMMRILVFVAGLVVAILAAIGYGQRLREYR